MSDDGFKLPISSYEELIKIIRAYGTIERELSLTDVSQTATINSTTISGNNAFLVSTGIIEGGSGGKKIITKIGHSLALSLDHEMPSEIRTNWENIIKNNEFLSKIYAAIRIRKVMDRNTLISHIAYSAGQKKGKKIIAGAGSIIDILKAAELIIDTDDKIVPTKETISDDKQNQNNLVNSSSKISKKLETEKTPYENEVSDRIGDSRLNIEIKISVNCTSNEFLEFYPKLKELTKERIGNLIIEPGNMSR
jgi:hypothetical protein